MPLEIRELIVKITVEETSKKKNTINLEGIREVEHKVDRLEEQLAALTEKIDNIYNR